MRGRRGSGTVVGLMVVMGVTTVGLSACGSAQSVSFGSSAASSTAGATATGADGTDGADGADPAETSGSADTGDDDQGSAALSLLKAEDGSKGSAGNGRDIPPIPEIVVPDVTVMDAASRRFATKLGSIASPIKGVTVSGAVCNGDSVVTRAGVNYGDGSGVINRGGSSTVNYGDGSGTYRQGSLVVVNYGDGSGTYTDGRLSIVNYGDGSGTYTDGVLNIVIYGDGSGTYADGTVSITNHGDGSGSYSDGTVSITNYGDGSGTYTDGTVSITNYGDSTGKRDDQAATMSELAPIAKIGTLPTMKALRPLGKECGTLIRLQDRVLFDFDKATLRSSAAPVLDSLAAALKGNPGPLQINGHTDALGTDEYNLDLSERRAQAVAQALSERGVSVSIEAHGLGEKQPIARNTLAGKDNPAGRQLNRRVEIVVPNG